mgnify:CR=1 FL=1
MNFSQCFMYSVGVLWVKNEICWQPNHLLIDGVTHNSRLRVLWQISCHVEGRKKSIRFHILCCRPKPCASNLHNVAYIILILIRSPTQQDHLINRSVLFQFSSKKLKPFILILSGRKRKGAFLLVGLPSD